MSSSGKKCFIIVYIFIETFSYFITVFCCMMVSREFGPSDRMSLAFKSNTDNFKFSPSISSTLG